MLTFFGEALTSILVISIRKSLRAFQIPRIKIVAIYTDLFFYAYTPLFCCKIKRSCAGLHQLRTGYDHERNMHGKTLHLHKN